MFYPLLALQYMQLKELVSKNDYYRCEAGEMRIFSVVRSNL